MFSNNTIAFYGDDFTGSTDALESLSLAGANTRLFIDTPTEAALASLPKLDAFGIAGKTRSLTPAAMEASLRPALMQLKSMGLRHIHYKVCSTFDSSPQVGSIGKVMDIAQDVFGPIGIPLLVAAPALGRYGLFGHLFAQMGIGSNGTIYRLDRHPSMKAHPVTPATESDLRLHLSKQTNQVIGLINILDLEFADTALEQRYQEELSQGASVILFDALYQKQLTKIGCLFEKLANAKGTLFSVGSSAIESALGATMAEAGKWVPKTQWPKPIAVDDLLVLSGSCSPVTDEQIKWAADNGFEVLTFNAEEAVEYGMQAKSIQIVLEKAAQALTAKQSVVIHSNGSASQDTINIPSDIIGCLLGQIGLHLQEKQGLKRVVLAGGDSSSHAARTMGIEAVEMLAPLVAGAPLCTAFSSNPCMDGIEINFKGGQVGAANYFGLLRNGSLFN